MINFDEIAKRTPLDRAAANSLIQGAHFEFDARLLYQCRSETPLPITTRKVIRNSYSPPWMKDEHEEFTGRIFGRLTVLGRFDCPEMERKGKTRWVVRCTCGIYETRRSKALREQSNLACQMCSHCRLLEERKLGLGPWCKTGKCNEEISVQIPEYTDIILGDPSPSRFYKKVPIPPALRWEVWERDDFTCRHCGSRKHLAVDHILAESKGGLMTLENLQTLCGRCNSKKGSK